MYCFDSRIRYSETDSEGRLTLPALLNYFQDSSTFHSEDLGVGVNYMKANGQAWVLAAWQVVINRMPVFGEIVEVGTAPYDFKGFIGSRNFWLKDSEGNYLAKANSVWSLLDVESGRPVTASREIIDTYGMDPKLDMEYAPRKIIVSGEGAQADPVTVRKQHLDTNLHVNNGQFVSIAMDYVPEDFQVKQLRVEYRQQAFLDDILYPVVFREEGKLTVVLNDDKGKPYVVAELAAE